MVPLLFGFDGGGGLRAWFGQGDCKQQHVWASEAPYIIWKIILVDFSVGPGYKIWKIRKNEVTSNVHTNIDDADRNWPILCMIW